jgi:DNA invertase Pin-like site-specific DNA recombinase
MPRINKLHVPLNEEQKKEIKRLFKLGHGSGSIAIKLKILTSVVYAYFKKEGMIRERRKAAALGAQLKAGDLS